MGLVRRLGNRILLAGGRSPVGTAAGLSELSVASTHAARTTRAARHAQTIDVYAHDNTNMLTGAARLAKPLVYVPNSGSNTVDVIDPRTYRIVDHFAVDALPEDVS